MLLSRGKGEFWNLGQDVDQPLTGTKEKKGRIGAEAHRAAAGGQGGERHWLQMASLFSLKKKMCYLLNLKDKVMGLRGIFKKSRYVI